MTAIADAAADAAAAAAALDAVASARGTYRRAGIRCDARDIDDEVRDVLAEAAAGGQVRADLLAVAIEVAAAFAEILRGWAIAAGPSRRLH
ncbi:MAG TPA: hypothetical protein VKI44_11605 [Acetobacteraceae bacterium]|nr:hypothetical protein [Acetobacteraceae bacterium]